MGQESQLTPRPGSRQRGQSGPSESSGHNTTPEIAAPGHTLPPDVIADLRTDHAGEVGAVYIYAGVLWATRDAGVRAFAVRHLATEQAHLRNISEWLPANQRTHLLPVWRLAGWLTGALPALAGPRATYITIEAVERFVDQHYAQQIARLGCKPHMSALRQTLLDCQRDEVHHRDEAAAARGPGRRGLITRAWCALVDAGSRAAVHVCRYV